MEAWHRRRRKKGVWESRWKVSQGVFLDSWADKNLRKWTPSWDLRPAVWPEKLGCKTNRQAAFPFGLQVLQKRTSPDGEAATSRNGRKSTPSVNQSLVVKLVSRAKVSIRFDEQSRWRSRELLSQDLPNKSELDEGDIERKSELEHFHWCFREDQRRDWSGLRIRWKLLRRWLRRVETAKLRFFVEHYLKRTIFWRSLCQNSVFRRSELGS